MKCLNFIIIYLRLETFGFAFYYKSGILNWSRHSLWLSRVKSQGKLNKHHQKELSSVGRVLDSRGGGREYDSWNRTNTQGNNSEKKVQHLPCKRLDLRVDQMTKKNGCPVSSTRN